MIQLLGFSVKLMNSSVDRDDLLFNGRGAVDYIEREIEKSYRVHEVKDKNHTTDKDFGFILETKPAEGKAEDKQYILYTLNNNRIIRRTRVTDQFLADAKNIDLGNNAISERILSIDGSFYDSSRHIINLKVTTADEKEYSLEIYVGDKINET